MAVELRGVHALHAEMQRGPQGGGQRALRRQPQDDCVPVDDPLHAEGPMVHARRGGQDTDETRNHDEQHNFYSSSSSMGMSASTSSSSLSTFLASRRPRSL